MFMLLKDLILFPTDATFVRVPQAEGRVYVLKFSSSNQRHFFWLQNAVELRDEEFVHHINRLLEMPGYIPVWSVSSARQEAEAAAALQASTSQAAGPSAAAGQPTADQLTQLRDLVSQMAGGAETQEPELSLTDILTPAVLTPLLTRRTGCPQ
ncbi:hypothetical protein EWM64_g3800 [Hericium alpestre]|uniref:Pru domain-containing protein n=1 Tax=Hericium alpestre TaxID=135208 RepID=A0A4Y9ZZ95_9AGAM|nr:hypothetical protein EWM64_g3800 [Hericium alpestre]